MAKQMMQDIVTPKSGRDDRAVKESPVRKVRSPAMGEATRADTNDIPAPHRTEEPLLETAPVTTEEVIEPKEKSAGAPAFSSLETSPIFEKMKRHNKARESFSDEFDATKKNGGGKLFGKIAIIFSALLLIGSFLYGIFFYDAVLTISLKHADVATESQEIVAGGTGAEAIAFQLMTLSEEDSAGLTATGEKNVSNKASGKIVVYNTFGAQSQPLIKNTRFQSPDGKIYRIRDSVVIPGQKVVDGKTVPGSLDLDVYADAAGADYNIGLVDFTIPGFKGSPRYEKFYGRSKTPMTGGFSGAMKVVSPEDVQKAKDTLMEGLKDKLFTEALAQKPKGTVLYKDAVFYTFTDSMDNSAAGEDNKTVKLTLKGSLTATLFNAEVLSKRIVKLSLAEVDASPNDRILVTNIEELGFTLKNPVSEALKEGDTFTFMLTGDAHAVWQVDTLALASKLAGIKKADYKNVFADFPGIEKANARIRPFWKTKFPSDVTKIQVEVAPN